MLLEQKALCKKVAKLELKKSTGIKYDLPFLMALEVLLLDVYCMLRPQPSDYERRHFLVQMFNKMAKDIFGNENDFPIIEAFGSFIMDLFTERSDLDLSLNFNSDYTTELPRDKKIASLRKFSKYLYAKQAKRRVSGVQPILGARVPVLKVVDCSTGVECDISVENKDGISRTLILKFISSIDERFRILSYLMKGWAVAHGINSSKDRTMNSLTIISLVAFHLQTRDPPILPPFSALLKDGTDISSVQNAVLGFSNFGNKNEESISKLFVALLCKLSSVESLWPHGLCASTFDGSWISKQWKSGIADMSVEDFLDRSQNFARAVAKVEMQKINKCIQGTLNSLSCSMKGQVEVPQLKKLLFGSLPLKIPSDQLIPKQIKHKRKVPPKQIKHKRKAPLHGSTAAPPEPITTKRARNIEATRPTDNVLPTATICPSSFSPCQTINQAPVGSSSIPSQSGYELCRQRSLVAPHQDNRAQQPQHSLAPNPLRHLLAPRPPEQQNPRHPSAPNSTQQNPQHPFAPNFTQQYPHHPFAPNFTQQYPQYPFAPNPSQQYPLHPFTPNFSQPPFIPNPAQPPFIPNPAQQYRQHPYAHNLSQQYPQNWLPIPAQQYLQPPITPNPVRWPQQPRLPFTPPQFHNGWKHQQSDRNLIFR